MAGAKSEVFRPSLVQTHREELYVLDNYKNGSFKEIVGVVN